MEEKKKDKSTKIIIVLLIIVIILLVAGYVVLFIMKDKLLEKNPPIVNTTTTTVETTGGEKTTEPTTKKVEELKNINQEYTNKLNEKVNVSLSDDENKYGIYHKLYVTGNKQEDLTAVMQFYIGDASFVQMLDLRAEYPLYDPETENFDELLKQEASNILSYFTSAIKIHQFSDLKNNNKYYAILLSTSTEVDSYDLLIFDKRFGHVYDVSLITMTGFSEKKSNKSLLSNGYYEIKDNKILYFENMTCKVDNVDSSGTVEMKSFSIENGNMKTELVKKYNWGPKADELEAAGATC